MSRKHTKEPRWLDWSGRGYHGVPAEPVLPFPRSDPSAHPDQAWLSAFQHARRGDFRYVPELIGIVNSPDLFCITVADLVGSAGASPCFAPLREFVVSGHFDYDLTFAWCEALSQVGRLSDVPLILQAFENNNLASSTEQDIVPIYIESVIDDGCGIDFGGLESHGSIEEYRGLVLEQCRELAERHGGEDVLLWKGAPRSVRREAEALLAVAHGTPGVARILRRRFETSTGIDCSQMYKKGVFKTLEAAAILEAFLDGPAVDQFEDGQRYFFGHPVP